MSLAPVRTSGPFGLLQREADVLKAKIDEVTAITKKWTPQRVDVKQVIATRENCVEHRIEASSLLLRADNLAKQEEPELIENFDQKKTEEIKRLQSFQERLDRLIEHTEYMEGAKEKTMRKQAGSPKKEVTFGNSAEPVYSTVKKSSTLKKAASPKQPSRDQEEEAGSEEEDADLYVVLHDFEAEQHDDLDVKAGDIIDILVKNEDGWWKGQNEEGDVGLVPSNFLRPYDEEEEDVAPYVEEERGEEEAGGDGYEEYEQQVTTAATTAGKPPMSPPSQETTVKQGKALWAAIRDTVTEPRKLDVTEVLAAMGAIPAGFRPSTLRERLQRPEHQLRTFLLPSLTPSRLAFDDLHWDPVANQLRQQVTRILRTCQLIRCQKIPLPGVGVEVLSRQVRIALFDGTKILSNVQTIQTLYDEARPKAWDFATNRHKVGGILPSLLEPLSLVRSTSTHANIGILFELGLTYIRNETGERGELSCGWSHLKLFDETGNPIPNRTFYLALHGGTPFEKGVEVDPSIARRTTSSRFRALLTANKQPILVVKIGLPSLDVKKLLEYLPATIVIPSTYGVVTSFFRRILADSLLRDRLTSYDADVIHSPVISSFLEASAHPDLMDGLRVAWSAKLNSMTRADKRDKQELKERFKRCVMETIYPLLHDTSLREAKWAEPQADAARQRRIMEHVQAAKADPNAVVRMLLANNHQFRPFDVSELTFDLLIDHTVA